MKYIIGLLLLAIALVIPTTLVFAFNASWAIKVDCSNGNFVTFHPSFTNNDQAKSFNVFVKENQSGIIVDLGTVQPGKTVEGIIATNLLTIPAGSVQFKIVDSSDQNSIDYQDLSYDAT